MLITILAVVAALFVGAAIGALFMAMCCAAARGDRERPEVESEVIE